MLEPLSRRRFVAASAATLASIGIVRAPARAAQYQLKLATDQPAEHPLNVALKQMIDTIRAESGGRVDIQQFPNNQLGGDIAMLEQLRSGAINFFALDGGILQQLVPSAAIQSVGFAFKTTQEAWSALDGDLGAYVRKDMESHDIYGFRRVFDNGLRQITSSTHPIHDAGDLSGFKIRTPPGALWVDLFRSFGASAVPIIYNELYTALQTKIVDGQENPYTVVETVRLYEVQKYLSVTNHMWSGFWLMANLPWWKTLPPDIQAIIERNAEKAALAERQASQRQNDTLAAKLKSQGMIFNVADVRGFRARLGPFYAHWKSEFGSTAWGLLERTTGPLA